MESISGVYCWGVVKEIWFVLGIVCELFFVFVGIRGFIGGVGVRVRGFVIL